jgi:hypothetical protein
VEEEHLEAVEETFSLVQWENSHYLSGVEEEHLEALVSALGDGDGLADRRVLRATTSELLSCPSVRRRSSRRRDRRRHGAAVAERGSPGLRLTAR